MPTHKSSRFKFKQKEVFLIATVLLALALAGFMAYKKAPAKTTTANTKSSTNTPPPAPAPVPANGSTSNMISELSGAANSEDKITAEASSLETENVKPDETVYNHIGDSLNDTAY